MTQKSCRWKSLKLLTRVDYATNLVIHRITMKDRDWYKYRNFHDAYNTCVCVHLILTFLYSFDVLCWTWSLWMMRDDNGFYECILNRFAFMGFIWFLPKVSLCKRWLKSRGTMLKHAHSLSAFGSVPLFPFFSFFLFNYQCADRHYSSSKHLNRSTTKRQPR